MFRKYAAIAALIWLAATRPTAFAEKWPFIPTEGKISAAYGSAFPTCIHNSATHWESNATSGIIFSASPIRSVALPLAAPAKLTGNTQPSSPGQDYTTQSLSTQEQKMLNLLNSDRKNNGLAALAHDPELSRIARVKSADMRDRNYFAHESPTYGDVRAMLKSFGYEFRGASENIAHHANVDRAQAAFLSSPGHRANILGKGWTKVGVGIVFDKDGFIYATQIFAR